MAQLSPWLLWPPDGLNLKQGTCGELFGYGYLPLPLTTPKATTAGKSIPNGGNSWTLFLNTRDFKGPVTLFTPCFWSRGAVDESRLRGLHLDSRPSDPNRALQTETQSVPAVQATASGLFLCAGLAQASTCSVINTRDSGAGSLREAILAANANAGQDTIQFNIPGPGAKAIQLASALPPITAPVTVNGYNPETPTLAPVIFSSTRAEDGQPARRLRLFRLHSLSESALFNITSCLTSPSCSRPLTVGTARLLRNGCRSCTTSCARWRPRPPASRGRKGRNIGRGRNTARTAPRDTGGSGRARSRA